MTSKEQLQLWVKGTSAHNHDAPVNGGECCPDFSCCIPTLKVSRRVRNRFLWHPKERDKMLGMFLAHKGLKVTSSNGKPA